MPALLKGAFISTDSVAVQKGRVPKSPLEGSIIDQFLGTNNNGSSNYNGFSSHHISNYTNFLVRADNISRYQHYHQNQPQSQQNFQLHQNSNSFSSITGDQNIYEVATRLLFNTVEWARNVPFFSALPTADQMALLKSSWSELYILNTSQHCSIYQLNARSLTPISPQGEPYPSEQRKRNMLSDSPESSYKAFEDLVEKFKNLRTDAAEFSCLKALVLFNPDSPGITSPSLIENLQEKAQSALEEYLRQHSTANYSNRFGKLLLRLPALSLIRPATIETLFFSRNGQSNVDNLVGSMLLYGSHHGSSLFSNNMQLSNNFSALGMNLQNNSLNNQINALSNGNGIFNQNGPVGYQNGSINNLQTNGSVAGLQIQYPSNSLNSVPTHNVFSNPSNLTSGLLNAHSILGTVNRTTSNNNSNNNASNGGNNNSTQALTSPRTVVKSENSR